MTLIFRTLDALRVFDVFFVMFGAAPARRSMAIYDQSTIVATGTSATARPISVAIFLIIGLFVVIYMTFLRVSEHERRRRADDQAAARRCSRSAACARARRAACWSTLPF